MNRLVSFFKQIQLGRMLAILVAGVALFLTTACNSGNLQGARPDNLPVQMGGNNNPHTKGGDGYTNYKMSTDPTVNQDANRSKANSNPLSKRADLTINFGSLVADRSVANRSAAERSIDSNASDLLYPGADAKDSANPALGPKSGSVKPASIPAQPQRVIDRSDPNEKILEKIGQQFKDASEFLTDTADSAGDQPELQNRPDLGR
jgi:hypothetical protein